MIIIKRNGKEVSYDETKIFNAIAKANKSVPEDCMISEEDIHGIVKNISDYSESVERTIGVEEIQDKVEEELIKHKAYLVAKNYIVYRYKKSILRKKNNIDQRILSIVDQENEEVKQENANKNPILSSTQRDYIAGEVSRDITNRLLLAPDIVSAHNEGIIHFHDSDYFVNKGMFNCCLINLEDMLQNGTVISKTKIEKPHSFQTACNITTQIIAQIASGQYGGQSINVSDLAPFVDVSRQNIKKRYIENFKEAGIEVDEEHLNSLTELSLKKEIKDGVQLMQYQILTLMTTNGQSPFVTFFMYLNAAKNDQEKKDLALVIEEILKQRMQGVKNEQGAWITPAFPKLIYVLQEDNIKEDAKYFYLTKLAAECSAKRLCPDYVSEKIMKKQKVDKNGNGQCYSLMGCRSCLTPYIDEDGNPKYSGRFNQGVVSLNLPYIALMADKDINEFWKHLDNYAELCHRALRTRHERLLGTTSDVSPIHWQHGAIARLKHGEKIDKYLYGGYSTISLGYAGLWECVMALIGKKLTEEEGRNLGLEIMNKLNSYTAKWKAAEKMDYSLYGTPLESCTLKFAKALQKNFGKIKDVSDHMYVTNSYHINVREPIDAFSKLELESKFQALSPGGAISYIETANMQKNIPAVLEVMKFIYDHIMYAEINTYSDHCGECGFSGQIELIKNKDNKFIWKCPNCGNEDISNMTIIRRICGYISSSNDCNQGRLGDIHDRVLHL